MTEGLYSWQKLKGVAPGECAVCGAVFERASYGRKRCLSCELSWHGRSRMRWQRVRAEVFARDEHICAYCGHFAGHHPEVDHVMPSALGGLDTPDNLVCACWECNSRKKAKYLSEYLDEIGYTPVHNPILLKCLESELRERRLYVE